MCQCMSGEQQLSSMQFGQLLKDTEEPLASAGVALDIEVLDYLDAVHCLLQM